MNSLLRLALFFLACAVGLVGVVTNNLLGMIVALVLMASAFWGLGDASALSGTFQSIGDWARRHPSVLLGIMALLCSVLASWIATHDEPSLAAACLWIASLFLIALAALRYDHFSFASLRTRDLLRRRELVAEVGLVALVTLLAFVLRAYDLEHFPTRFHGDEAEMGLMALRILAGKDPVPLFATGWLDHPTLFHYLQAASLAIFGKTETGLRMLSAIFGTACVPLLYWIGRAGWGRLAGITAAWLMAVSHMHIHFSRLGMNNIESVFSMVLFVLWLAVARELSMRAPPATSVTANAPPEDSPRQRWPSTAAALSPFVGAGLVMGLGQYLYYGSRLIPAVAAPLLLFLVLEKKANVRQVALLSLAALLAFAPLGLFYLRHLNTYFGRMSGVSIFLKENVQNALGPQVSWPKDALTILRFQVERNLSFFVHSGDASGHYYQGIPAFDALTSVLFWLGLGIALTRARRYHEFVLLIWFGLGVILAGVLTADAPFAPRLILVVPSVYLLGGLFVHHAAKLLRPVLRLERVGVAILGIAAALTLGVNANYYFVKYAREAPDVGPIMVAREIALKPDQYHIYLMGAPVLFAGHGVIRFVARDAQVQDLDDPNDLPPPNPDGKGTLVIALAHRVNDLQVIAAHLPGGVMTSHSDPMGRLVYMAYRVPPRP
jgi:4-amino-4-deoxy-L-arabinose transferase-like glycosyltransferase